ncbi:MAG: hypothetical protein CMM76_01055 [Rhodospirillaceae bacterium]|nr:hypothetical protein [Rhodospirillaceae bacterium]
MSWFNYKRRCVMTFKLWGRPTSARTEKVMLALAELNIEHDYILSSATMGPDGSVTKGGKAFGIVDTTEYLAMNPNGTVPTINDNGYVLWESNAIIQYLGMKYDPGLFYDNDIETYGSAARWLMWENNQLIPPMHELVMHLVRLPEDQRDTREAEKARQKLIKEFTIIEEQLGKTEYIAANRWTMGDIPLTIRCHRWHLFDIERPDMPNLSRYYSAVQKRPSFQSIADPAMHVEG